MWNRITAARCRHAWSRALAGVMAFMSAACAGSTVGSGVGDTMFERPPFHAGRAMTHTFSIGHVAIVFQHGAADEPIFDPSAGTSSALASLVAELNTYLDSLRVTTRLVTAVPERGRRPDVQFGCVTDIADECEITGDPAGDARYRMRLAITRPSSDWAVWFAGEMRRAGLNGGLLITLEVGQYWPRQRNWLGSKEIELGTDYAVALPWLTALDRPIRVLQLTGALLDEQGRAIRIGAEGLLARRTNLLEGSLGLQALITDEDVQALRESRRNDLPGRPRVWEVGLRNLIAQLTGGMGAAQVARTGVPRFEDHRVDVYRGPSAPPDYASLPGAHALRDVIETTLNAGANFAGQYALVRSACGEGCERFVIVDVRTGRIFEGMEATPTLRFRADSRLLVIDTLPAAPGRRRCAGCTPAYYVWADNRLELVPPELYVASPSPSPGVAARLAEFRAYEPAALARTGGRVLRPTWDRLVLLGRSGARRAFIDEVTGDEIRTVHVFRGTVAALDRHHVEVVLVPEGGYHLLIDAMIGDITPIDAPPIVSPDGLRFATASVDLVAGHQPNRFRIYRVDAAGPVIEWEIEPRNWGIQGAAWLDGETITAQRVEIDPSTRPFTMRTAPLVLRRTGEEWVMSG